MTSLYHNLNIWMCVPITVGGGVAEIRTWMCKKCKKTFQEVEESYCGDLITVEGVRQEEWSLTDMTGEEEEAEFV